MPKLTLSCPNDGRKLKILITALLKKGLITDTFVQNNCKHYRLCDGKVQKIEKRLVTFRLSDVSKSELIFSLIAQIASWKVENGDIQVMD